MIACLAPSAPQGRQSQRNAAQARWRQIAAWTSATSAHQAHFKPIKGTQRAPSALQAISAMLVRQRLCPARVGLTPMPLGCQTSQTVKLALKVRTVPWEPQGQHHATQARSQLQEQGCAPLVSLAPSRSSLAAPCARSVPQGRSALQVPQQRYHAREAPRPMILASPRTAFAFQLNQATGRRPALHCRSRARHPASTALATWRTKSTHHLGPSPSLCRWGR